MMSLLKFLGHDSWKDFISWKGRWNRQKYILNLCYIWFVSLIISIVLSFLKLSCTANGFVVLGIAVTAVNIIFNIFVTIILHLSLFKRGHDIGWSISKIVLFLVACFALMFGLLISVFGWNIIGQSMVVPLGSVGAGALIAFVILWISMFVFFGMLIFKKGDAGANQYGEDPLLDWNEDNKVLAILGLIIAGLIVESLVAPALLKGMIKR